MKNLFKTSKKLYDRFSKKKLYKKETEETRRRMLLEAEAFNYLSNFEQGNFHGRDSLFILRDYEKHHYKILNY